MIMKESLCFKQLQLDYMNNEKTNKKGKTKFSKISFTGAGVVAKSDDEVYALNTMRTYIYFSFLYSTVPNKVQLLKIPKNDVATLRIVAIMQ